MLGGILQNEVFVDSGLVWSDGVQSSSLSISQKAAWLDGRKVIEYIIKFWKLEAGGIQLVNVSKVNFNSLGRQRGLQTITKKGRIRHFRVNRKDGRGSSRLIINRWTGLGIVKAPLGAQWRQRRLKVGGWVVAMRPHPRAFAIKNSSPFLGDVLGHLV